MKQFARKLPRAAFYLVLVVATVAVWRQIESNPSITTPALCTIWFLGGLFMMGPVRQITKSQAVIAAISLAITAGINIYYWATTPNETIGTVALLSLFAIFAVQALLRLRNEPKIRSSFQ